MIINLHTKEFITYYAAFKLFSRPQLLYLCNNAIITIILKSQLLGILIGSFVAYFFQKQKKKSDDKDNAYISAILIRFWLIESLSSLTKFEENLKLRLSILEAKKLQNPEKDSIVALQDFDFTEKHIAIDYDIIKKLCPLSNKYTDNFEQILQFLSISENAFAKAIRLKSIFNSFKMHSLSDEAFSKAREVSLVFPEFLESLKRFIPEWLKIIEQSKKRLNFIFNYFQKHVCIPLGAQELKLSPGSELVDRLMTEAEINK